MCLWPVLQAPDTVAVQVFLQDRRLLERNHAKRYLTRRRSFEHFQTETHPIPQFKQPSPQTLIDLQEDLDDWFEKKKRGRGSRVFVFPKGDSIWFLVHHGDPFRREGSFDAGQALSVFYWPVGGELLLSPQSVEIIKFGDPGSGREDVPMRDPIILLVHLIATLARLMGPGGLRSVVAESVLVKQQLLILNRSRHRAPNLCASDRILAGVCALFMRPARVIRSAIVLRPSTILEFHRALRTRKYRWLFSPTRRRTGPQGPSNALVDAIVDMKRRNPRWGCPRIAQQIALAFAVDIDKDVVRRVLATHYRPAPRSGGPSWLTFLGHAKDSLWSIDLFRCESATLRSHWVLVVMDQYTRRIVGFGIHAGTVDGRALCRMFNHAIRGLSRPKRLSSDHDPLYRFHPWCANLRVLQVTEVKSVPYVPLSHPFVERLIGTLRRECVDQLLFWSASDLEDKLVAFQDFYNAHRAHASLDGRTPVPIRKDVARLDRYRWDAHCRGLYQTPIAA